MNSKCLATFSLLMFLISYSNNDYRYFFVATTACKDHPDCQDIAQDLCQKHEMLLEKCPITCGRCNCNDEGDCDDVNPAACRQLPYLKKSCKKSCKVC